MVSLRLARGDLKFRVNAKNDDSKCAFKHMVHVDEQCNLSCSCARQKQDRTSPQRKHLHAKKKKNLRCLMFFFVFVFFAEFRQTNHVLYRVTLSLCKANIIIDVYFI